MKLLFSEMNRLVLVQLVLVIVNVKLTQSDSDNAHPGCPQGKLFISEGGFLLIPGCKRLACRDGLVRTEFCPPVPEHCVDVRGDKSLPFPQCCDSWIPDCGVLPKRKERAAPDDEDACRPGDGSKCDWWNDDVELLAVPSDDEFVAVVSDDEEVTVASEEEDDDADDSDDETVGVMGSDDGEGSAERLGRGEDGCTGEECSNNEEESEEDRDSASGFTPEMESALGDRLTRFSTDTELCMTRVGYLRVGDTADLEGCQQLLCEKGGRNYILSCEVPPGCRLVRQNFTLPFPGCCPVTDCPEEPEGELHVSELAPPVSLSPEGPQTPVATEPLTVTQIYPPVMFTDRASDAATTTPEFVPVTTVYLPPPVIKTATPIDGGCRLESGQIIPNGTTVSDFLCRGLACVNGFLRVTCCHDVPVGCTVIQREPERNFPACCPQYVCP